MFDKKVNPNTIDGEKLRVALLSVKNYEDTNYAIPFPDPIATIK